MSLRYSNNKKVIFVNIISKVLIRAYVPENKGTPHTHNDEGKSRSHSYITETHPLPTCFSNKSSVVLHHLETGSQLYAWVGIFSANLNVWDSTLHLHTFRRQAPFLLEEPYDKQCTLCLTKVDHYYYHDNFGKSGPSFIVLLLLNSETICGGTWN